MLKYRTRAALFAASFLLTGCGAASGEPAHPTASVRGAQAPPGPSAEAAPREIPGLGPRTRAAVPPNARQVVVVSGRDRNSPLSSVVLYRRTGSDWQPGASWAAHNALRGWSDRHMGGDLRSPVGVYGLTDAGGLLADPGTKLPYDRGPAFRSPGTGFEGEPLDGSFDYVVAINYNRKPGTSPLDWTRPLGASRGGGIWFHVDHGGPTHGCVSLAEEHMKELLRTLDPALHPVVVMGDHASLAR
ncbi:lipoprotein [Streptomyces humidus]|uniref:Lipoprotein n=1 Tax=Streptomyces humidus TaxID=52259 RepID=A0A918G093_9ACTN|nr:L,D-transpeptidase family protein [Streptomyces humidus]GGS09030.1 lipoprotein [Streptomyces humidus]